jgi:hypothetical protein
VEAVVALVPVEEDVAVPVEAVAAPEEAPEEEPR